MEAQNGDSHANELDESEPSPSLILADLMSRAKTLLSELEQFGLRLKELRKEGTVEVGHFRGTVKSELGMLERLEKQPDNPSTTHVTRSSNLPFLETVWATVKKSRDVASLQKRIYVSSDVRLLSQGMRHVDIGDTRDRQKKGKGSKDGAVLVDAISNGGQIWTKVSLLTNTRLIFDLAKQGWDSGGSDSEEDEWANAGFGKEPKEDDHDVPLLKTAKELTKAARCFRVRSRQPVVHMILPRIEPGKTPEIDNILKKCRATGAALFCGKDLTPVPELKDALKQMAPDPMESFSETINIDCTILLALVSEFSHAEVSKEDWFHVALRHQVDVEGNENLLPALLYPAMGSRRLVCTREAATRMREIVDTIGTQSEKERTAVLMGDDASRSQTELVADMQATSSHTVPAHWQLPIKIIGADEHPEAPAAATHCCQDMTAINRSVFLFGWANQYTTITSNRTVVKQMESDLERFVDLEEGVWPRIWLCPTARSLVGKEKRGVTRKEEKANSVQNGGHDEVEGATTE